MRIHTINTGHLALLAAGTLLLGLSNSAFAQVENSVVLPPPTGAREVPATGPMMQPVMQGDAAACCSIGAPAQPCIDYRTHRSARKMYRCTGEKPVVVMAKNLINCCDYEVPLCIPCCCEGVPCVTTECSPLGRAKVEYCWDCGFKATVVFRARGDIMVHYKG
jgi:hypothetical protein